MKRKTTFALALLVFTGAALWVVNWRLDHPPLSRADKEFRVLVAGADGVHIYRNNFGIKPSLQPTTFYALGNAQTRQLLGKLRFSDESVLDAPLESFALEFRRGGKIVCYARLSQRAASTTLLTTNKGGQMREYKLQPRFAKRLELYLNQLPAQSPPLVKVAPPMPSATFGNRLRMGPPPPVPSATLGTLHSR